MKAKNIFCPVNFRVNQILQRHPGLLIPLDSKGGERWLIWTNRRAIYFSLYKFGLRDYRTISSESLFFLQLEINCPENNKIFLWKCDLAKSWKRRRRFWEDASTMLETFWSSGLRTSIVDIRHRHRHSLTFTHIFTFLYRRLTNIIDRWFPQQRDVKLLKVPLDN